MHKHRAPQLLHTVSVFSGGLTRPPVGHSGRGAAGAAADGWSAVVSHLRTKEYDGMCRKYASVSIDSEQKALKSAEAS